MNGTFAITVAFFSVMQSDLTMCTYNVLVSLADDFCTLCLYFHLNIFANIEGMFSEKA